MDREKDNYEPNFILRDSSEHDSERENTADNLTPADERSPSASETQERRDNSGECSAAWCSGRPRPARRGPGEEECFSDNISSCQQAAGAEFTGRAGRRREKNSPVVLTRKRLALLIAVCMVLSCLCGMGGSLLMQKLGETPASTGQAESVSSDGYSLQNPTGANMSVAEINEVTRDSVVEITTESVSGDSWLSNYVTQGAGSGVIITKDGYIMTNNHVIDGASKITVTTTDEKSYDAVLVGADSSNDVAVLKIDASNLKPVTYGNSDNLKVGDLAVAIGNPLGELGGTVTAGIISATDRAIVLDGKTMHLLQTDSSINPGNSGGGLFNDDGQLIGLVVAKSSGSDVEGLGFAIPVNVAADVAQQLMDNGYVKGQPWTGMTYTEGSSGFDSWFGMDSGTVYIYSVDTDTAKDAGFSAGDIVYAINGDEVTSIDDVSAAVTAHKVGDTLTFTIVRDGQSHDIKLKLQEKTKQ
ncbi:MAG: S1C family serine protease [Lentihominibacter sp.]